MHLGLGWEPSLCCGAEGPVLGDFGAGQSNEAGAGRAGGRLSSGTRRAPPSGLENGVFPYLSLSSLLTDESRLSTSLSLS